MAGQTEKRVLPKSARTHELIRPSLLGKTEKEREAGRQKQCVLTSGYPCHNPVLALGDAPRHSHLHPQLFLFQDALISSAHPPTPEPSITKVNLLLKGVVCRVSVLSSFGVHLPEGAFRYMMDVSLFSDILGCHVVARQDFN